MKKLLFITATIMVAVGCNKQPTADFTTDKTTYYAGETIHLTSSSTHASSYKWTMPDGQTSAAQNLDYSLSEYEPSGILTLKLQALSKKGNKTSDATKNISVIALTGSAYFWNCGSCSGALPITVTVNGISKNITAAYNSDPGCVGSYSCANFISLPIGTYDFNAVDALSAVTWNGTVIITKNGCTSKELL